MSIYMGFPKLPASRVMASIERFGTDVMPRLRAMSMAVA
jgi:hypothetical protein